MKLILISLLTSLCVSCGFLSKDDSDDKKPQAKPDKHQVAVVGTGFDIENSIYADKIKNAWDVRCEEMRHPFELLSGSTRYEELKKNFMDYLELRKGCSINKKMNNEISSEFAKISGEFNEWNSAVLGGTANRANDRQKIQTVLAGENGKFNYTGTASAGLIASDNDKVDLHIISVNLKRVSMFNDIINGVGCRSQSEVDLKAKLFKDEEVVRAFVDAGREDADTLIASMLQPAQVAIVNESFGPNSIGEYEEYYRQHNCQEVNFRKLILAESELANAREQAVADRFGFHPLVVKGAGSAGQDLNLVSDTSAPCEDDDLNLLVGALDREDKVAQFSNKGRCVDVFTLGADVKTFAPKDFRNVENGTIFSAPLLVRYITLGTEPGSTPEELKKYAFDSADENKMIKLGDWNRDFAYKEKNEVAVVPRQDANPVNDPNNNQQGNNNQYKEGWNKQIVDQNIEYCVTDEVQTENGRAFCKCFYEGVSVKYTVAQLQGATQNDILNDQIYIDCRQNHPFQR